MNFSEKKILVISPEAWGKIHISKHHYALTLAENGNRVYFLSGFSSGKHWQIEKCGDHENISLIMCPKFLLFDLLRFRLRLLYRLLIRRWVKGIFKQIRQFDLCISFERSGLYPDLSIFKADKTIFFPVDQVQQKFRNEYKGFEYLVTISPVILKCFSSFAGKKMLLQHGLNKHLVNNMPNEKGKNNYKRLKLGYIGNLLIGPVFDRKILQETIGNTPNCEFHFFGPYRPEESNIGVESTSECNDFISFLNSQENCFLHGVFAPEELTQVIENIDGFLLCYDYKFDKNECSNSHKVIEYLSTGKPIISTRISMYDELDLFPMLDTFDNAKYSDLLQKVVNNWSANTTLEKQQRRREFALEHTYEKNIERLAHFIEI